VYPVFRHDAAKIGDTVGVAGPAGQFTFDDDARDRLLLIGGGVGLTPLMSTVRDLTARGWPGRILLIASVARPEERLFGAELDLLAGRHPSLQVVTVIAPPDAPSSWIDAAFLVRTVPEIERWRAHVCGPTAMMYALSRYLQVLGVPPHQIWTEAFSTVRSAPAEAAGDAHEMRFVTSARTAVVSGQATVLDAAEQAGVPIDASCRVGICGACKVRLLRGRASMRRGGHDRRGSRQRRRPRVPGGPAQRRRGRRMTARGHRAVTAGLVAVLGSVCLGFVVHRSPRFAGSLLGSALGATGAALTLVPLAYAIVRRVPGLRRRVTRHVALATLLRVHVACGLVGPILAVLHTWHRFEHPVGIALTAAVLVVAGSGFVGHELLRRTDQRRAELLALRAALHARLGSGVRADEAAAIVDAMADLELSSEAYEKVRRWMRHWRCAHVVLTTALFSLLALHIWAALYVGVRW
jgi:ferredoxin-NADP reductase